MWSFVIVVAIPCLWMAGANFGKPEGNWFLGWICVWVLLGAIEVLKYVVNHGRVELLRETKQTQLQILELHALMNKNDAPKVS